MKRFLGWAASICASFSCLVGCGGVMNDETLGDVGDLESPTIEMNGQIGVRTSALVTDTVETLAFGLSTGKSVSFRDGAALVGAPFEGQVFIFQRDLHGNWKEAAELQECSGTQPDDRFVPRLRASLSMRSWEPQTHSTP